MTSRTNQSRSWFLSGPVILACVVTASAAAQTVREVRGAAAVEPLQNEPPAKIIIDPPVAETLSHGRVVIQYRTENLHTAPVFGPAALAVSPRVGHIHVNVDDAPWVWADTSGEPVILEGLPPGPHKVLLQLESANHQLLDKSAVKFSVPAQTAREVPNEVHEAAAVQPLQNEPPAKLIYRFASCRTAVAWRCLYSISHGESANRVGIWACRSCCVSPDRAHPCERRTWGCMHRGSR